MKSIKVCEYSRSRSFHDDLILQDQASGERSQDQWSSGSRDVSNTLSCEVTTNVSHNIYHNFLYNSRVQILCSDKIELNLSFSNKDWNKSPTNETIIHQG